MCSFSVFNTCAMKQGRDSDPGGELLRDNAQDVHWQGCKLQALLVDCTAPHLCFLRSNVTVTFRKPCRGCMRRHKDKDKAAYTAA